jgi:hypothetical protein
MQRRANEKYAEIKIKDKLWGFANNLVFEKNFTEFVKKDYDWVPDKCK